GARVTCGWDRRRGGVPATPGPTGTRPVDSLERSAVARRSCPARRLPLLSALSPPERWESALPRLDLAKVASLHFEPADPDRSPGLAVARHALSLGGTAAAGPNARDREAVGLFLQGAIRSRERVPLGAV